jgi:peptide deformylase
MSEGCLSVRGKYGTVMRYEKATIKAQDEDGKPFVYHGSGLIGHIFQHECDHLDGILYIEKAIQLEEDEDIGSARIKVKEKHGI